MQADEIRKSVEKARKGIEQYLEIMELFPITDVSKDKNFQRKFNAFYRVRQRPLKWYEEYYSYMQSRKGRATTFSEVLMHLFSTLNRYEPSFSSKLVATLNVDLPVWDSVVLGHAGLESPRYGSGDRFKQAEDVYRKLKNWYREYMDSTSGKLIIELFQQIVPEHSRISDLKKIDFVLWQNRAEKHVPQIAYAPRELGVKPKDNKGREGIHMLTTHGGRKAKCFDWMFRSDVVKIKNENGRQEEYSLDEILAVLNWLTDRFGAGWFPLANNVEKLGHNEEADGLGVAILRQKPRNIRHAQGSSYLGVVLERVGILEWNNKPKGIEWRIISQVQSLDELRKVMNEKTA